MPSSPFSRRPRPNSPSARRPIYLLLVGDVGGTNTRLALYSYDSKTSCSVLLHSNHYLTGKCLQKTKSSFASEGTTLEKIISNSETNFELSLLEPFLLECQNQQQEAKLFFENTTGNVKIIACLACAGPVAYEQDNGDGTCVMSNIATSTSTKQQQCPSKSFTVAISSKNIKSYKTGLLQYIVKCYILNDLVAAGYGILTLHPQQQQQHQQQPKEKQEEAWKELTTHSTTPGHSYPLKGPKVCIGAGTGLGMCFLTPNNKITTNTSTTAAITASHKHYPISKEENLMISTLQNYTCYPSEGGQCNFAPRTLLEMELWSFLANTNNNNHHQQQKQYSDDINKNNTSAPSPSSEKVISSEDVISGRGLSNIYKFLCNKYPNQIDPSIHTLFVQEEEKGIGFGGRVIGENCTSNNDNNNNNNTLCDLAVRMLCSAFGSEVGNIALRFIPTGGLYIMGGLTPKLIKYIEGEDSPFMKAYRDKGRVSPLLDTIPLFAVMVEDLGLRGAHFCALKLCRSLIASEQLISSL